MSMLFKKPVHRSPVFFWVTLIATTILLLLIIFVQTQDNAPDGTVTVAFTPTNVEKEYTESLREFVSTYFEHTTTFDLPEDTKVWNEHAQTLHDQLIALPVPPRLQTVHLSAVLQIAQTRSVLTEGVEDDDVLEQYSEKLLSIVESLKYD